MTLRLILIITLLLKICWIEIMGQEKKTKEYSNPFTNNMPIFLFPSLQNESLPLVFLISGDGGWASFNKNISETLAKKGIPVIGLDSRKFFWKFKPPEVAATKIAQVINHYLLQWKRTQFVFVGYSFGAGVVPFIANSFQEPVKRNLKVLICLSPSEKTDFEVHLSDMIKIENPSDTFSVINELKKDIKYKVICIFGDKEDITTRLLFEKTKATVMTIPGKHDFNLDYIKIAELIEKESY